MGSRRIIALVVFVAVLGAALGAALASAGGAHAATPGKVLWSKRMTTAYGRDDYPQDMKVAADGSVYVLSKVRWGDNGDDTAIGLVKFSPTGTKRWQRVFRTSGALQDSPMGLALDGKGNAYVVGNTITAGSVNEGLLVKYTAAGKRRWVRRFAGATTGSDALLAVACDPAGNPVVCGRENVSTTEGRIFVRKYGAGGSVKWTRRHGPGGQWADGAEALAIDKKTGAVYVGGCLTHAVAAPDSTATDVVLLKYNSAGKQLWVTTWGSLGGWDDTVDHLVLGPTGEVYVAANVREEMWGHAAVLNFGPGGALHWSDSDAEKSPAVPLVYIQGIAVDGMDRVRIILHSPPSRPPVNLRLYGADGALQWERPLPLGAGERMSANDLAVTSRGRSYVTGFRITALGSPYEWYVMNLRADGTAATWTTWRTDPGAGNAGGSCVELRDGRLYAAGYFTGGTTGADVMTMRLVP